MIDIILQEDMKGSVCCKNAIVIRFYEKDRYEKNEFCFGDVTSYVQYFT